MAIGMNQLQFYAVRRQHGSHFNFATFIWRKITRLLKNSITTGAKEKLAQI
jgi:hypothetical protein